MLHTFPALPSYVQFTKINLIVGVGEVYFHQYHEIVIIVFIT